MHIGQQTIAWLHQMLTGGDRALSASLPEGFRWWPNNHAQTIAIVGEERGPEGEAGFLIGVRTEMLRGLVLNDTAAAALNTLVMPFASLSGPVYDPETQTLSLCTLARIYDHIATWMRVLLRAAAWMQAAEAPVWASALAQLLPAQEALAPTSHQESQQQASARHAAFIQELLKVGKHPYWRPIEFQMLHQQFLQRPPVVFATVDRMGVGIEFPFGQKETSLCEILADQPHPRYGYGLFLLQSFPAYDLTEQQGIRLAFELNALELTSQVIGYGFGSYVFRDSTLYFTAFFPNLLYRHDLLANLFFSCAARAQAISLRLTGCPWPEASFRVSRSAIGRMLGRFRGK